MSMTDLKALGERAVMGARKLPAAPALFIRTREQRPFCKSRPRSGLERKGRDGGRGRIDRHHIVDSAQLFHARRYGLLETFDSPHVHAAET